MVVTRQYTHLFFIRSRLEFPRNGTNAEFRRSYYIINDLKYLLTSPPEPEVWNNDLRKGFLHGVSKMLDILLWMQGMDEQVRFFLQTPKSLRDTDEV